MHTDTAAPEGTNDITAVATTKSPLLNLPAELRNEIYSLALTSCELVETTTQYRLMKHDGPFGAYYLRVSLQVPSLLQTSRQIRAETMAIFYGANTFKIGPHLMRDLGVSELSTHFGPLSRQIPLLRSIQIETPLATYTVDLRLPSGPGRVVVIHRMSNCGYCKPGIDQTGLCRDQDRNLRLVTVRTAVEDILGARGSTEGIDEATLISIFGEVV